MEVFDTSLTFTSLRHKDGYIEECKLLLKLQRRLGDLFLIKRTEKVREYGKYFCCDFVCYIGDNPMFFLELKARNGITELSTLMINDGKLSGHGLIPQQSYLFGKTKTLLTSIFISELLPT